MGERHKKGRRVDQTGRSLGRVQFIGLHYAMVHHPAFRSLSGAALKVFLELRSRFNGHNNGHLHLAMGDAAKLLGLGKTTVRRALKELERKGFIRVTRPGQWYGRVATSYRCTDCVHDGRPPTRDWQRLPLPEKTVARSRDSTVIDGLGAGWEPITHASVHPEYPSAVSG